MHRFNFLLFFLLLCSLGNAYAQQSGEQKAKVTGRIVAAGGADFFTILLKDSVYGTTTDKDGNFELSVPQGSYILLVRSLVADVYEQPITLKSGELLNLGDIMVEDKAGELDQIVVTGQFTPQSMRNSLYKVRTVSNQIIAKKAAAEVTQLLNTEIGIRLSNDMALGESSFELMGMSGTNVKILLNGMPLVDRGDSQSSLNQIDVNSIERIEIVEGPMSVIYGSDALAGVINIITKQAAKVQGANSYHVGARIQEESVGREYSFISGDGIHNESVDLAFSHKSGFFVNGGLTRYRNGGWWGENSNRAKEWKAKNQLLANGTLGYSKNGLNLWYRLDCVDETIWGPEDPSATTPYLLIDQDYLSYRFNHQLQGDWIISDKFILNMAVSYQDYNRRTYTVVTNTNTEESYLSEDESAQAVTNYNALMARMTAAWSIAPSLVLQPGVEYQWTHGTGERISGESAEISYMAYFLSAEWKPLTWLSIRPGARSFIFSDYNAPTLIPSLLTKFNLTEDLDLRLSYAYGFRTPGIQELYFSYHDNNHDIDGNPDLTAEYSNSFIGSLTYRMIKRRNLNYSLSVGGYYNYFRDRISLAVSVENPSRYTYYNQDIYKTVGGTLENSLIWKNLRANINFALIGRYNDYFGADDSMTEEFRFSPELTANISYGIPKWGTEVNLFYKFTGARNEYYYSSTTDSSGQTVNEYLLGGLPSYNISDLTVSQKLTEWVSLNLGIKNLFNVTTLNSSYITTDSINPHETSSSGVFLGYGRSWSVGLVFSLDAIK